MANAIGRLRKMGIAAQPTFGTPAPSASYVMALTNAPQFTPQINKILNEAALGSAYSVNEMEQTTRFTDVPLEFKVDEDIFPLLLMQRFSIASVTVTGETVAYEHTLSYEESTQTWYTLFLQDDNLQDYVVKNALFDTIDPTMDQDFLRVTASVVGAYPTQTAVVNVAVQPKEFVGRMITYTDDDAPSGTETAIAVLSMTGNLDFGLNSDETRFSMGNADITALELTADKYMFNIVKLKSDVTYYDDNENLTLKQFTINATNTDRFISPTSTNPSIVFTVPRSRIENYTESPDLNELTQENFDLTALKPVGISGAPMSIVVVNAVESY